MVHREIVRYGQDGREVALGIIQQEMDEMRSGDFQQYRERSFHLGELLYYYRLSLRDAANFEDVILIDVQVGYEFARVKQGTLLGLKAIGEQTARTRDMNRRIRQDVALVNEFQPRLPANTHINLGQRLRDAVQPRVNQIKSFRKRGLSPTPIWEG